MVRRMGMGVGEMALLDKLITVFYRLSIVTMSLSAAVWSQFWMHSFCLQPSLTCAELLLIEVFDIAALSYACTAVCIYYVCMQSLWEIAFFL